MEDLTQKCSIQRFSDIVSTTMDELSKPMLAQKFGLVSPLLPFSQADVEETVRAQYERLFVQFEKDLQKRAAHAEEARIKLSAKDAAVAEASPSECFTQAVESVLEGRLKQLGLTNDVDMVACSSASSSTATPSMFVASLSKNVLSPLAGVGEHTEANNFGRAKAKSAPSWWSSGKKQGKRGPRHGAH